MPSRTRAAGGLIDIDTGGTFTDGFIADHRTGRVVLSKVPSTPHDPSQSLLDCTAFAAAELGISQRDLLQGAGVFRYSSTISTNAIIEHRGLRVGLLVAEGTEHALALTGERRPLVDQGFLRPELVAAVDVPTGGEPEAGAVVATFQRLVEAGAQTVLIAFAGSGRDETAERAAKRAIRVQYPAHYLGAAPVFTTAEIVSGGDDVLRVNTAFLAAYVHHHLARYLFRAEERLRAAGLTRPLLVVHADGGVTPGGGDARPRHLQLRPRERPAGRPRPRRAPWRRPRGHRRYGRHRRRRRRHRRRRAAAGARVGARRTAGAAARPVRVEAVGGAGGSIAWVDAARCASVPAVRSRPARPASGWAARFRP